MKSDRLRYIIIIILLLVMACAPQPIEPTPTPTPQATQDIPKIIAPLNVNPGLAYGGCNTHFFHDGFWGMVSVKQCYPDGYSLYQLLQTVDGNRDNHEDFITTNPMAITNETGLSYTIYPGGRAGRIGFTSELVTFPPGCYAIKTFGQALLWGEKPEKYTIGAIIGDQQLYYSKQAPTFGDFEIALFWLAQSKTVAPVTWFMQFGYGHADAKSRVNISRLELLPVTLAHCG